MSSIGAGTWVDEWQSRRFWGFKSRCTMPRDWKAFIADATHHHKYHISSWQCTLRPSASAGNFSSLESPPDYLTLRFSAVILHNANLHCTFNNTDITRTTQWTLHKLQNVSKSYAWCKLNLVSCNNHNNLYFSKSSGSTSRSSEYLVDTFQLLIVLYNLMLISWLLWTKTNAVFPMLIGFNFCFLLCFLSHAVD